MPDLYRALAIIWGFSAITYLVMRRCTDSMTSRQSILATMNIMGAGAIYAYFFRDHVFWSTLLPFSGLIVLSNWFPIFCAAMAATSWQAQITSRLRRLLPGAALLCLGIFSSVHPLTGHAPCCSDTWNDDVCLQSSRFSCSAACAATLLKSHGIKASESELVELCLTRKGTTWQGLFRGLTLKTQGTEWKVIVESSSVEELLVKTKLPAIISVGIPARANTDPIYVNDYGLPPGQMHSVVLQSIDSNGRPEIADPSIGREFWSAEDLRVLYRGTAVRLVGR